MRPPKLITERSVVFLAIAVCLLSGCYVEVDKHYRVSPTLENPLEFVLGGKVTDQLLAVWEASNRDSDATLESLRQSTDEVPIVVDNPLRTNKSRQQFWNEAIEGRQRASFQAAIRAVSLRPADRALAVRLTGSKTNKRVGWWTWRLRKFEGIAATTAATECAGHPNDPVVLTNGLSQRGVDWAGADLMTVVELSDSERLFIFGDTLQGEVDVDGALQPGFRMVRNSALLQTGSCFTPIRPAGGAGWIPGATETSWLWPQDAFIRGDDLFVFMVEVTNDPNGIPGLEFKPVGGALAVFDLTDGLEEPKQIIRDSPTRQQNPFGTSVVEKGAFLYLYGHGAAPDTATYVARVRTGEISEFSAWRFWNGRIWQRDPEQSAAISPVKLNVSSEPDGTLLAATLPFGGTVITTSTSRRPLGPFDSNVESIDLVSVWPETPSWAYRPIVLPGRDQYRQRTVAASFLPWDTIDMLENVRLYGPRFLTDPNTK